MGPTRTAPRVLWTALAFAAAIASVRVAFADRPVDERVFSKVHVIDFDDEIEPALAAFLERSMKKAKDAGADCVVFRIESPGGRMDSMERIIDAILALEKPVRTVAWVKKSAYSAAAMSALACDEIVMASGARMGDAQPILMTGEGFKPAGEKIETVARALARRLAEAKGWEPLLVEKFVSKDREVLLVREKSASRREHFVDGEEFASASADDLVAGVPKKALERVRVAVPKERLLTLTAAEAKALGFVARSFESEGELLAALSAPGATVTQWRMSWQERAGRWLLGMVGILGGLFLLCAGISIFQGVGIWTAVGVAALALIALVSVTSDLANGFSLFLIALGVILLAAEAFVIPGFGVAGIAGIVSTAAGFLFLSTGFTIERSGTLSWDTAAVFLAQFALTLLVGGAVVVGLSRVFPSLPFARRYLQLPDGGLGAGAAVLASDVLPVLGAMGAAATTLRPAGRATINGRGYDVTTEGGFVEPGSPVRVVRIEGSRIVVRAAQPSAGASP